MKKYRQLNQVSARPGNDPDLFNADWRCWLHPHCLPDACRAVVVNSVRQARVRLFTSRLLRILTIFNSEGEPVVAGLCVWSYVELEWDVATLIVSDLLSIDPDG